MTQAIKDYHCRWFGYFLVLVTALVFYGLLALGIGVLLGFSGSAQALEADYAEPWCAANGGVNEKVLTDRTRVDCLLPRYAVEVDFAPKWAEAMGQALHYGRMTQRTPAVLLILKKPSDVRFAKRLQADAKHWDVPLEVWTVPVVVDVANNKNIGSGPP
ncbi:MAG: hypothetical protein AB9Q22_10075 [Candidatus Reddybacter sp.]